MDGNAIQTHPEQNKRKNGPDRFVRDRGRNWKNARLSKEGDEVGGANGGSGFPLFRKRERRALGVQGWGGRYYRRCRNSKPDLLRRAKGRRELHVQTLRGTLAAAISLRRRFASSCKLDWSLETTRWIPHGAFGLTAELAPHPASTQIQSARASLAT
jgi:hypothetical protein